MHDDMFIVSSRLMMVRDLREVKLQSVVGEMNGVSSMFSDVMGDKD